MTWAFLTTPIARAIAKIGGVILAVLTFGAYQRRKGAQAAKAARKAADAKAATETTERVLHETVSDDPADAVRRRMRERAKR